VGAKCVRTTEAAPTAAHPRHPCTTQRNRSGRQFELFNLRRAWGEDRVWFFDEDDALRSLPAAWTDVVPPDPAVAAAAGRAAFRAGDLLQLARLLRALDRPPGEAQP
jgi:Family of unknown function (DUF5372)